MATKYSDTDHHSVRAGISRRAGEAFHADMLAAPAMTLRGGYAEDSYEYALAPDRELDTLTDSYLSGGWPISTPPRGGITCPT